MAGNGGGMKTRRLTVPISDEALASLEIGTVVFLDGLIMTGREKVYKRILEKGESMPEGLTQRCNVGFHCSPAASVNEDGTYSIGAVTATASFRFAKSLPNWFAKTGCRVIIGKGGMSQKHYDEIFVPAKAVYFTTVGYGTGALLGRCIKQVENVYWLDELGIAQAMWVLKVENFGPLLVESDLDGNSLFEQNNKEINDKIDKLYEGLRAPSLSRYGETDNKRDELI
jgi:L(+)-tartrate dehydratase beta subunit